VEGTDRERRVMQLLRQLSVGLSAYRLFPANLDQPGFVNASQRIDAAADEALADGPVDAEVTAETFTVGGHAMPRDEAIARLANACFERRVERFRVRTTPSRADLAALYAVLTTPVDEVMDAGGADGLLRRSGVMSVALGELNPQAVKESVAAPEVVFPADPAPFREDLLLPPETVAALAMTPLEMAESLYDRFQAVVGALPPEMQTNVNLYRMLRESVDALPAEQRRMLNAVLLDRALTDPLAERYVGTMSDTELARVIVDVAERFGRDPREMAARLVAHHLRSEDLVDLADSLAKGRIEGGTVLAGSEEIAFAARSNAVRQAHGELGVPTEIHETVGDILGQSLLARGQKDLNLLREQYPETDERQRVVAVDAVRDYLEIEEDLERLDRVLDAWMQAARASLRAGDVAGLREAVGVLERPRAAAAGAPERARLFEVYRDQAPESGLLRELVQVAKGPGGHLPVAELLSPLEGASVRGLLDLLADDGDGPDRTVILALATELAREYPDVLFDRVADPRGPVARDATYVAYWSGGPGAMRLLEMASRHPAPEVRVEAVRGLIAVAGANGIEQLRHMATDPDEQVRSLALAGLGGLLIPEAAQILEDVVVHSTDKATRKAALDHLARHPLPVARERLKRLASGHGTTKLPRQLRRAAKRMVKRR